MLNDRTVTPAKRPPWRRVFWQDTAGLAALAVGSLGIGLLANGWRQPPLPLVYVAAKDRLGAEVRRMAATAPTEHRPEAARGRWQAIELDKFQELIAAHRPLCIDARAKAFYLRGHVPGAINLPREGFEQGYAAMRAVLEPAKEKPIVIYCSEADCPDSELVADALSHLGYRNLFVYKEGWEEWLRAGLPREEALPL